MSVIHPAAAKGFGRDANTYVRGRPDFPPTALAWLREDLGLQPGKTVIDLGNGARYFPRKASANCARNHSRMSTSDRPRK